MSKRWLLRAYEYCGWVFVALVLGAWPALSLAAGSIKTDGSVGAAQTLAGPSYFIPQTLGTVSGGKNLFHSFGIFNVGAGETALFTTTTPTLVNVISRVTGIGIPGGLQPSQINGRIQLFPVAGSAPNFFFINPAGVIFGAGASVVVPAAFYVSTAQYLKFPDGTFYADTANTSTFSAATPEAFGFLGNGRAAVTINPGANVSTLNNPFHIVAGDVTVDNVTIANLAGDIRVVAAGRGATEIGLNGTSTSASGTLTLSNGGFLSTAAAGATPAGNIAVSAGTISINGAGSLISSNTPAGATARAGTLDVLATQDLSLANGGRIVSSTSSSGDAGPVQVTVGGVASILNGGSISSNTFAGGKAGSVNLSAGSLTINGQGTLTGIFSDANAGSTGNAGAVQVAVAGQASILTGGVIRSLTVGRGNAGSVNLSAGSLTIDRQGASAGTGIGSDAEPGSTGNAGLLQVTVVGQASILNGGAIVASTFGSGSAGNITVSANSLNIESGAFISNDARPGSTGNAGSVQVAVAGQASILNGGVIASATFAGGTAGAVNLSAGSLTIDAQGTSGVTGILSDAERVSTGNAGTVQVAVTGQASILHGGTISSHTFAGGNAGSVNFSAGSLTIDGQGSPVTGILANAVAGSTGNSGAVDVKVTGQASILNGGSISSTTLAAGNAGAASVSAGNLTIDGRGATVSTGIFSSATTGSTGNGGSVDVKVAGQTLLLNAGRISASTSRPGDAGSVSLSTGTLTIDSQGSLSVDNTGIFSIASTGSTGNAGSVQVAVAGQARIFNKGQISTGTSGPGNAGSVNFSAGSLTIDSQGSLSLNKTGIFSSASTGSTGNAGSVQVAVAGQAKIFNEAQISTSTSGPGNAGSVNFSAGSLTIDGQGASSLTGISSSANAGSTGNAGTVDVKVAGQALVLNAGQIRSNTSAPGNAGSVNFSAGSLTIDGQGTSVNTGILSLANSGSTGNAGSVDVKVAGQASVLNGGQISSSTSGSGIAGKVMVGAGTLSVDGTGSISAAAATGSSGQTGSVTVSALNSISLTNGATFSITNDASPANPGVLVPTLLSVSAPTINLNNASITAATSGNVAASNILVSSPALSIINAGAITSDTSGAGNAGTVTVNAGTLGVQSGGAISSGTSKSGNAGTVAVITGSLSVDQGQITSQANTGSTGNAGSVQVAVTGLASLLSGGVISSSTAGAGKAGTVTVNAASLTVDGTGSSISAAAATGSSGQTGDVSVMATNSIALSNGATVSIKNDASPQSGTPTQTQLSMSAPQISLNNASITAATTGNVAASNIVINPSTTTVPGSLAIANGGAITSDTSGSSKAGTVTVNATSLGMQSGGRISSNTSGSGNAGTVTARAASLATDGQTTAISSQAVSGSSGNAGSVDVGVTGLASLLNGGVISSSTAGAGKAGTVTVNAGNLTVDGTGSSISAAAAAGSSGQTGNVTVKASDSIMLSNSGKISIANDATVANPGALVPTLLSVTAPMITMMNSSITAASTGNVAASDIFVKFVNRLFLDPSFITTSAFAGNGGSITIQGDGPFFLNNSLISTSVTSPTNGNGGNIIISVPFLGMNTGFIQANTAAAHASGGNVTILADTVNASGGVLVVGGFTPLTFDPNRVDFNVIQAVAPSGLSGNIQVTAPALNVSGVLTSLSGNMLSGAGLGRSLCAATGGSSFAQTGRGAMPMSSGDLFTVGYSAISPGNITLGPPSVGIDRSMSLVLARCP